MTPPEPPDLEAIRRDLERRKRAGIERMTSDDDLAALCDRVERLETALHRIVDDRSVPTEWHAGDYRNIARVALAADPPTEGE